MTEIDYLKLKLEDKEKAFDKLHKLYIELLKKQRGLEKENNMLKERIGELEFELNELNRINNLCEEQIKELRRLINIATHNDFIKDSKKEEWKKELEKEVLDLRAEEGRVNSEREVEIPHWWKYESSKGYTTEVNQDMRFDGDGE